MAHLREAGAWLVALALAGGSIYFWSLVVRGGDDRFRERVERRFDLVIGKGPRGHWQVSSGRGRLRDFGIELLQLAYFMGAFVLWALGLLVGVGLLSSLQP